MNWVLERYLEEVPGHRIKRFSPILNLSREMYPDTRESINYDMPAFESATGRGGLANKKNYIPGYACLEQHIASFKVHHPAVKTGKGCINLTGKDMIQPAGLAPVITSALEFMHV